MAAKGLRPLENVGIRLYCHGLGDCFLLAFPQKGNPRPFRILIDCGVVVGTPQPQQLMKAVAEDLEKACEGHLDLLIVTHEHWDHLSGFNEARAVFERIAIAKIWLAWTENPKDKQANDLREARAKATETIRKTLVRRPHTELNQILEFFGAAASGEGSTREALDWVKGLEAPKEYLEPDTVLEIPGARIYVLGPPRDAKLLKKSDPSKGDVFGLQSLLSTCALASALEHAPADDPAQPFENYYRIPEAEADFSPLLRDYRQRLKEARIDEDWMHSADGLGLQLDSDTNNTSLALAFELPNKEILLFPGDAQVGNWRSWWKLEKVQIQDIFSRTVFYKVGHHGSHNATLAADGLERMTHPELTAFVPIDQARAKAKGWGRTMPWPGLMKRLREKTDTTRLLLADEANPGNTTFRSGPQNGTRPLYVEYFR